MHFHKSRRLLSLVVYGLISTKVYVYAQTEECLSNTGLLTDTDVIDATKVMMDAFNKTCNADGSCLTEAVASVSTTKNDYTSLVEGGSLTRMEKACNDAMPGATLCLVTNEILKGSLRTLEIGKPVCFPPSCDANNIQEVRFLDSTPGNCDPTSTKESCEVVSTSVMCPVSRVANLDSATCPSDAVAIVGNSGLDPFVSFLRNAVMRACISVLLGGTSEICDISTPLKVTGRRNYTDFDNTTSDEFASFKETCSNAEIQTSLCRMSTHISAIESDSFIDIESDLTFTQLPLCLPSSCSDADPVDVAMEQLVTTNFKCDSVSSVCKVTVSDFSCETLSKALPEPVSENPKLTVTSTPMRVISSAPSFVMSASPSGKVSISPSTTTSHAPSNMLSLSPSTTISDAPSNMLSLSPSTTTSNAPTNMLSLSPSTTTSDAPTIMLSLSPSISASNAPSNMLSLSPSISASDSPSNILSMSPSSMPTSAQSEIIANLEEPSSDTSSSELNRPGWVNNKFINAIIVVSSLWALM